MILGGLLKIIFFLAHDIFYPGTIVNLKFFFCSVILALFVKTYNNVKNRALIRKQILLDPRAPCFVIFLPYHRDRTGDFCSNP